MTRTRTLVIIGCFMLVLAVLAALELRSGESVLSEGQTVTGALSKENMAQAPQQGGASAPSAPQEPAQAALPQGSLPATTSAPSGSLMPLDNGTLRASAPVAPAAPATPPVAPSPVANQPATKPVAEATAERPGEPVKEASPPARPTLPSDPLKTEQAKPDQSRTEQAKAEKTSASTASSPAAAEPAPAVKQEVAKTESSSVEAGKSEAPKTSGTADVKSGGSKILTTRAPEKLLPGERAIVWTHLELDGKQVLFRFTGAAGLEGKGFFLPDPPRYVVDLQGSWGINLPKVPNNEFLKSIRAGRQEANTRLVFDLARPLSNCQVQKVNKDTLEVRIR